MEKKDLSLVRLEAIDEGWDGALGVHVGEGLLVDKVVVGDGLGACAVQAVLGQSQLGTSTLRLHPRAEPLPAPRRFVLTERQRDARVVRWARVAEPDSVTYHVRKVVLRLLARRDP